MMPFIFGFLAGVVVTICVMAVLRGVSLPD